MTLIKDLAFAGPPGSDDPIKADECYVEVYLESLRLKTSQRILTQFHGVVYAFVSLAGGAGGTSRLAAISKPSELAKLDRQSVGKVITVEKKLIGATPWRGGDLGVELGLFSVKTGNTMTPVVDYIGAVSTAAGASFVAKAEPFLPLLEKGMDLLAGQASETSLEIGVDGNITPAKGCAWAIVAHPKGAALPATYSLDPTDKRLMVNGQEVTESYCVFSIRPVRQKADYGEIPELKERYDAFMTAIRANRMEQAKEAFATFRLAVFASPDLILDDANTMVSKAKQKLDLAFPGGPTAALTGTQTAGNETLADLKIYE